MTKASAMMAQQAYKDVLLGRVLGSDWKTKLYFATICAQQCDDDGGWLRLVEAVKAYRPPLLVRLRDSVIDWLNG